MKRIQSPEYRVQSFLVVVFLLSFFILNSELLTPAQAQEPATQSSTLLQKIDSIKTEIASKAAALKNEVSQKISNKAVLGQIQLIDSTDKTSGKITIQAKKTDSLVVLINEYTIIQGPGSKANTKKILTLKDLSPSDVLIALGDIDDRNNLNAKKIVKLERYEPNSQVTVWGTVESVDGGKVVVKKKDGSLVNLQTSKNTLYKLGSDDADLTEVSINRTLIAVGLEKPDKQIETRFIYLFGHMDPEKKGKIVLPSPSSKPK